MKTLRELLRETDPVAHEPPLSDEDVRRMRREVLTAPPAARWTLRAQPTAWVAAGLMVAVGASMALRPQGSSPPADPTPPGVDREALPRQLQFDTPGGTRVIWLLHSDSESWR